MRLLALLLVTSVAGAQPDCRLARYSSDNFTGDGRDGTIHARCYQLHLISIGTAVAVSTGIHALLRTSPVRSTIYGGIATGVVPHIRGLLMHRYPFDGPDMLADATMRLLPVLPIEAYRERTRDAWTAAGWLSAAAYLSVACFAKP